MIVFEGGEKAVVSNADEHAHAAAQLVGRFHSLFNVRQAQANKPLYIAEFSLRLKDSEGQPTVRYPAELHSSSVVVDDVKEAGGFYDRITGPDGATSTQFVEYASFVTG